MRHLTVTLALAGLTAACATAPQPDSGFLSGYDGLVTRDDTLRVSIRSRSDSAALAGVTAVYIEPSALFPPGEVGQELSAEERAAVLAEVDRQLCYELSERYDILAEPRPDMPRVRAAVTRIDATDQVGSAVSAAAAWFIPGPLGVRPGGLGALAAEAEMVEQDRQIAAIAWARQANAVGTDTPSLSRLGDALQLAEPLGDAVGDAFAPEGREVREIADPDPCARFGPRTRPAGFLARMATGLYDPGMSAAPREATPEE